MFGQVQQPAGVQIRDVGMRSQRRRACEVGQDRALHPVGGQRDRVEAGYEVGVGVAVTEGGSQEGFAAAGEAFFPCASTRSALAQS